MTANGNNPIIINMGRRGMKYIIGIKAMVETTKKAKSVYVYGVENVKIGRKLMTTS